MTPPPGLTPHRLEVISQREAVPAIVPPYERRYTEFTGSAVRAHLETIVGFSKESQATKEVGNGKLWGRLTGFVSGAKTVEWVQEAIPKCAYLVRLRLRTAQGPIAGYIRECLPP